MYGFTIKNSPSTIYISIHEVGTFLNRTVGEVSSNLTANGESTPISGLLGSQSSGEYYLTVYRFGYDGYKIKGVGSLNTD